MKHSNPAGRRWSPASLAGVLLLAMVVVGGVACDFDRNGSAPAPQDETAPEAAVQYYCPMHCEGDKTYDEPGTCPVCEMDLVSTDSAPEDTQDDEPGDNMND